MVKKFFGFACAALMVGSVANGATVSFSRMDSTPGPEAVAAGAPNGGSVNMFMVTTDADILSIGKVAVTGATLFQVAPPFGSNTAPPDPAFINFNRALEADSWITTPGTTTLLGADLPGDGTDTTFGDLSNDGPKTNFKFASLTIPAGAQGLFTGQVTVAGTTGPESFAFSFPLGVPEPATYVLSAISVLGLAAVRRRIG